MTRIVPLTEWYPAMARKWASSPRRYTVPLSDRIGWTWHHFAFDAATIERVRRVADDHYRKWSRPGGYNYCFWQGDVLEMCGWRHVGAHAPGGNRSTLGVAFPRDLSSRRPPRSHLDSAAWLLAQISIPADQWPHSYWKKTACPGDGGRSIIPITPLEDDVQEVPQPDWLSDDVIDDLLAAGVLVTRPDREPYVVWRMYAFLARTLRASGGAGEHSHDTRYVKRGSTVRLP